MLSSKKSAQTPVFIAFFPLTTISTAKFGLNVKMEKRIKFFLKLKLKPAG
jgi:hypothetical protein